MQQPSKEALHANLFRLIPACLPLLMLKKKVKLNYNIYTHKCLNPEYTSHLGEFVQLNTLTQLPPRGEEIP